jgi:hypothetical protein
MINHSAKGTTVFLVFIENIEVEISVSFERLFQKDDLLRGFRSFALCICAGFSIALQLVEFDHLVHAFFVLALHVQFELELLQHVLDLGSGMRRVILDEVWSARRRGTRT